MTWANQFSFVLMANDISKRPKAGTTNFDIFYQNPLLEKEFLEINIPRRKKKP